MHSLRIILNIIPIKTNKSKNSKKNVKYINSHQQVILQLFINLFIQMKFTIND
jgi:hypothetical protein